MESKTSTSKKKFCIISDLHFCDDIIGYLNDQLNKFFFPYLIKNKKELSAVFIAGDIFDGKTSFNSITSFSILNFLKKISKILKGTPIIILEGTRSHDFNQINAFKFLEEDGVEVVNTVDAFEIDGVKVLCMPEEYPKNWEKYYKPFTDEHYDLIVMHGMIDFASHSSLKMESEKEVPSAVVFPSKWLKKLGTVAVAGHVHMPLQNDSIYYCSSFTRFCFGEDDMKGFLEVCIDPETNEYEVNRIENEDAPIFKNVYLSKIKYEDISEVVRFLQNAKKKYFSIRLIVDKEPSEKLSADIAIIREHFGSSIKLKLTNIREKKEERILPPEVVKILHSKIDIKQTIVDLIHQNNPNMQITTDEVACIIGK